MNRPREAPGPPTRAPRATNDDVLGLPDLSRREAIKLGAAATLAVSLGAGETACTQSAPSAGAPPAATATPAAGTFFTQAERVLVDELSELIVPTDDHSPGARAAKVASFIDGQLTEAWDEKDRTTWREGLAAVERISREMHGRPFMQASPTQRVALLSRISQQEAKPQRPEELFFMELKSRVVHAYYSSEIGIKQEMEYRGNVFLQEFVGDDPQSSSHV